MIAGDPHDLASWVNKIEKNAPAFSAFPLSEKSLPRQAGYSLYEREIGDFAAAAVPLWKRGLGDFLQHGCHCIRPACVFATPTGALRFFHHVRSCQSCQKTLPVFLHLGVAAAVDLRHILDWQQVMHFRQDITRHSHIFDRIYMIVHDNPLRLHHCSWFSSFFFNHVKSCRSCQKTLLQKEFSPALTNSRCTVIKLLICHRFQPMLPQ